MFLDLLNGFASDSTVKSNEVNAIFCMKSDNIDKVFCGQFRKVSLIMNDTVIDRNCSDHCRTFMSKFLTEWLCVSVTGKIHDCFCTKIYGFHDLLHFNVVIFAVSGYTEIYIDLGAEHASDTFRIKAGMMFVGTDGNLTFCYELHHLVNRHVFFLGNSFDLWCYDAFSCGIHLSCVLSHNFLLLYYNVIL